ncbi:MAG: hypothetical protein A2030_08375 [Chloroflexi bacterium RBG_19FT_COMBO_50_10]|nr:MAG: hypothetical protein A2030_08375 [Chloroflexi bacterium RBG_19FT_COMBO_50_10]
MENADTPGKQGYQTHELTRAQARFGSVKVVPLTEHPDATLPAFRRMPVLQSPLQGGVQFVLVT